MPPQLIVLPFVLLYVLLQGDRYYCLAFTRREKVQEPLSYGWTTNIPGRKPTIEKVVSHANTTRSYVGTITCYARSISPPTFYWYRSETVLADDAETHVRRSANFDDALGIRYSSRLLLQDAVKDCYYTCVVQNQWGNDSDWVRIMVSRSASKGQYPACGYEKNCTNYEHTHCSSKHHCICNTGYQWNADTSECFLKDGTYTLDQKDDIYRTAMITSACFLFAILLFLVMCVLRRSFCDGSQSVHSRRRTTALRQQISTISNLDALNLTPSRQVFMRYLTSMEKPPTYDESMRMSIPNSVSSAENIVLPPPSPPPYVEMFNQGQNSDSLDDFPPPDISSISSSVETCDSETCVQNSQQLLTCNTDSQSDAPT